MAEYGIDAGKIVKAGTASLDTVCRKIAFDVFKRVIMRTPVDTGRARGNWQCTIDNPAEGELDASHNAPAGGAPVSRAYRKVEDWKPTSGASIFLTNNLPYIERLEHGYSSQAPVGMVAVTIAEFGGIAKDAVAHQRGQTFGGSRGLADIGGGWDIGGAGE